MARQKGIIKLDGTIGDITFYSSKDGKMAREKGGIDATRMKTDPAFKRTRENGAEFGSAASAAKLLRDSFRTLLATVRDSRMTARLTTIMTKIKALDSVSIRGERNVADGLQAPNAVNLIKGFNFNKNAIFRSVLNKAVLLNTATGSFTINGLVPLKDVVFPNGATHLNLFGAWARVDFAAGSYTVEETNKINLLIDNMPANVNLVVATPPTGGGYDFFVIGIEFLQEVNGSQYALRNGSFNALTILEVM